MKATAKCPGCGHEIATSESVESFAGKGWSSDFLVVKEMSLTWEIDVEGVEVQFAPQENAEWVDKRTGQKQLRQKAHLHRWKVAEVTADDDDDDVEDLETMEADLAAINAKKRKSATDRRLAAYLERDIKKAKAKAKRK